MRVVNNQRRRRLLRLELELLAQMQPDSLRLEKLEEPDLIFEIGAGRVSERVSATAIVFLEELWNGWRILVGDAPLPTEFLVEPFR